MNRQIRLVGIGIMALFVALFVQLNYVQVIHASALAHSPYNGQAVVSQYAKPRGDIISADGVTLAQSVPTKDGYKYLRQYPTGSLFGQVTGFYSFTYGTDGVERSYNSTLTGANRKVSLGNVKAIKNLLTSPNPSQSVTLTLSDKLQTVARSALGNYQGSVVALDPRTGAILAMYSNPSYDPNVLAQHNQTKVVQAYKALLKAPGNPLSPAAYRQRWFPGSTFKMVTASAVYDHDPALANKTYPNQTSLALPNTTHRLHNYANESCGGKILALFTVSCDSGFGAIGLQLGASNLVSEAQSFGFDKTPPIDLPFAVQSYFPPASSFAQDLPGVAYSAIGQQSVQSTPLEMAMIAGAIANGGVIMTPHVLGHVTDSQAQTVATYQPKPWLRATSAATAASVTKLMLSVVNSSNGTGGQARIPGIQVAAKTGTAQTGTGQIDAWFAAFAPAANPSIAVAVLVPNQPSGNAYQGGTISAPIAKAMIQAYLSGGGAAGISKAAATPGTTSPNTSSPNTASPKTTTPSTSTSGGSAS